MGYINCLKCGCQMSDKSERCPECGLSVGGGEEGGKKCPECGRVVDELAVKCFECGFAFQSDHSGQAEAEIAYSPNQNNSKKIWMIVAASAFLLIGGVTLFFVLNNRNNEVSYEQNYDTHTTASQQYTEEMKKESVEPLYFTFAERTWLRSSPSKSSDDNKLKLLQYGSRLSVIRSIDEWTQVREIDTGDTGYVASDFLMNQYKFTRLNSLFSSSFVRIDISESKYRKALLQYAENNNMIGGYEHDNQLKPFLNYSLDSYDRMQVMDIAAPRKNDLTGDEIVEFKTKDLTRGTIKYITFLFDNDGDFTLVSSN